MKANTKSVALVGVIGIVLIAALLAATSGTRASEQNSSQLQEAVPLQSGAPSLVSYQGWLTDSSGNRGTEATP